MVVSPELRSLLKVASKAHPELQAMLIDLLMYKPKWEVSAGTGTSKAPTQLDMGTPSPPQLTTEEVESMTTAERALRQHISLPAKSRFSKGPHVHVQFDGGS